MELSDITPPADSPRFRVTITIPPAVERDENQAKKGPAVFMIKLIREVSGLGLRHAKDLYEDSRGFSKADYSGEASDPAYQARIEALIYKPFTFTVPALYTRAQLYRAVNKHSDKAKYSYSLVNDPTPWDLQKTAEANLSI